MGHNQRTDMLNGEINGKVNGGCAAAGFVALEQAAVNKNTAGCGGSGG